ncbi:Sterol 3-beta-glucosyltransferase-like protein [Hapsidospora chrysogenum ATCC 11550]|uniref:sterol 3beta-glucosyltransferase n=1 Tax=Hapsidospora chrysogenum (strain ATCC 11550 / CBS 779.69 / DSM 880 / IAM 14645 / JCM 23072 / IMI 49137) TaxID=857340 RepID=A0A086T8J9_HAPC1|nr:Sterol 3-beta-glucosyltransferase-like protein [Hapsidospora chrysogenum ATCC 11550]
MTPPPSSSPSRAASPGTHRRASRKLQKRRHEDSIELPDRLRDSDDSSDEDEASSQGPPLFMNMNQSIFGLIAAAGSKIDFNERFDEGSSDEDGSGTHKKLGMDEDRRPDVVSQTTVLQTRTKTKKSHRRALSGHKLLKSLPALPRLKHKSKSSPSKLPPQTQKTDDGGEADDKDVGAFPGTSGLSSPPAIQLTRETTARLPPVMSRMLEARAEMSARPSFDLDGARASSSNLGSDASLLAIRLMEIFEFEEPEQVIEEYPCWLLQSVLLQGYLYITAKHICFYSYLPKKADVVAKSGFLAKSGKRNPKYNRYWFRLKGDVLSYYRDATNVYFPHGQIDLSYGISASITDKDKEGVHFEVITRHRSYNFRADSAPSAKEWVKCLQRVIFRSHNDGDSVKISLPIANVVDIEEAHMMEFAETCKIRVIDNDETYAIDEYFFSFFSIGTEAIDILKLIVEEKGMASHKSDPELSDSREGPSGQASRRTSSGPDRDNLKVGKQRAGKRPEPVKATLSPMSPQSTSNLSPRTSQDASRRSSFDAIRQLGKGRHDLSAILRDESPRRSFSASRRSASRNRLEEKKLQQNESSESNILSSVDDPSFSNLADSSTDDPSASQILKNSEVFHQSPTKMQPCASYSGEPKSKGKAAGEKLPALATYSGQHSVSTGHIDDMTTEENANQQQPTTPTLQSITKMGAYPLQRVGAFADYLNKTRQRMSTLLASESMGYVEKVSGMWKGERKHYQEPDGLRPDDDDLEKDSDGKVQTSMERFRAHFALPETETLQATYFAHIFRVLPLYGKIYISDRFFCFRSLLPGTRTKLILPLQDIETAHKEKGFRFRYSGLVIVIKGHEELFFEFGQPVDRDDCAVTLLRSLEAARYLKDAGLLNQDEQTEEDSAMAERDALKSARQEGRSSVEIPSPRRNTGFTNAPTILDELDASFVNFKPREPMKITCLTIGSRGDVQPYIALCKGFLAHGHKPRIATHAEFQEWIESHGIEFRPVEGDPAQLMRLCIEHGTFTWSFLREANSSFRGWLDALLVSAVEACEGSDLLIESPSAMAGIHIAEKLGIPYFRAFTMPWTRTRAYPHAFIMPEHKMGGAYNYMTYIMFDNLFWKAIAHQINRWRNNTLGLPSTTLEKLQPNKVPFLYNFSPLVVAPPLDFSDWIRVTGYWFLDEGDNYEPPKELAAFIKKARDDGKKLVYVGFGSIIVDDPHKMTREVIDAIQKADVRCILSKGWSERITAESGRDPSRQPSEEPEIPPEIHVIKSAPHDWLFRQIDAAAHHGGAGTTGASLRAGLPTIIRPFFGDQFFFATRVEDLGVGLHLRKWGTNAFGRALWEATRNERMIVKARVLGAELRKESGVDVAIQSIYRDLEYATSLIKRKAGKNAEPTSGQYDADEEDDEESWTFIGKDEPDPEFLTKKLSEEVTARLGGVGGGGGGERVDSTLGDQVFKAA